MKRIKLSLAMVALLCCCAFSQAFTPANDVNANDRKRDKIELKDEAITTRSATATEVEASADDKLLMVWVENFTGDVFVNVFGANGAAQTVFSSYDSGYATVDISSLPAGTYTVQITADDVYEGTMEK